jgi:serine protease Do
MRSIPSAQPALRQRALAAAVIAALGGAAAVIAGSALADRPLQAGPAPSPVPAVLLAAAPTATLPTGAVAAVDFSAIVERYGPAVVNISVTGSAQPAVDRRGGGPAQGLSPDDPFYEFFRRFGPQFQMPPEGSRIIRGQGSGFIVSPDGVILTNAHVVNGAQQVTVKLPDRREFSAKVIGTDPQTDIAVIRIDARNLPTVKLGDPTQIKVGEPVLAIGSPFGFENTATAGIVSAKSRVLPDDNYVPFIQTDVAVNPGNSGGPLFNMRGEVVGINSQIYSRSGGYQGLSFAIPIDVASRIQQQLVSTGHVTRGRLGVTIQEVNQALADAFGLQRPMGALVSAVERDSPAARAGLEPGDVVVKAADRPIDRSADLPAVITDSKPGSTVKLEVIRKGQARTLNATVGEARDPKVAQTEQAAQQPGGRLGLAVRPLDREERRQAGVNNGLVIEQASGPAARAGLQPGDVILSCNGTPVTSVDQFRTLVQGARRSVALLVQREEAKLFVPVDLG